MGGVYAPDFMELTGDESGGVTAVCRHPDCDCEAVGYLGWDFPPDAPLYFPGRPGELSKFLTALSAHAASHLVEAEIVEE